MRDWQNQIEKIGKDYRTPWAVTSIALILLLLAIWQFITEFKTTHHKITVAKVMTPVSKPIQIANLHIFGLYSANVQDLPTTRLQLTLQGTIVVMDSPELSRAIIAVPNTPAKIFKIGDTLPGNASITKITKDFVVIDDNGSLQKLLLPVPKLEMPEGAAPNSG